MNDTMSLLLATGILAVGGLGLFMYKTSSDDKSSYMNDDEEEEDNSYNFDVSSYFGNNKDNDDNDEEYDDDEPEVYEPPKRSRGSKTKSVRKSSGTKRRY
jgi:hypothetical protein